MILIENLFFYIGIKNCKPLQGTRSNILLYLGILLIVYLTAPISLNVFRFVISIVLFQFLLMLIYRKTYRIYDVFLIVFNMLIKLIIEYFIFGLAFNGTANTISVCIVFSLMNILQTCLKPMYFSLYKLMKVVWSDKNKFYYRYILLIMTNGLMLFVIYSIIKVKEVMN